jgi:hypothetical protein
VRKVSRSTSTINYNTYRATRNNLAHDPLLAIHGGTKPHVVVVVVMFRRSVDQLTIHLQTHTHNTNARAGVRV